MKKGFVFIFLVSILTSKVKSQTEIGTTTPNASAKLEVYATNKGFLPPRVTLTSATDANTFASPAEGLLVYNLGSVGLQASYYFWNGANWATIATATGNVAVKVSGLKNAGAFISLDNLKATVLVENNYGGLSIAAVNAPFSALISGTFGMFNGSVGGSGYNANQSITTTATGRLFGWGFPTAGDASTYIITDNTNSRVCRVTLQINYSF